MGIFLFSALSLAAAQPALPSRTAVEQAVEKLDMTSFPNSLRPAAEPGLRTLRQFGEQRFAWEEGSLTVTQSDGSWVRTFQPLPSRRGRIRLCFADQALQGTYLTQQAIELRPGKGGLHSARTVRDGRCEGFAR